jgi:hypothetical protein
MSTIQEEVDKNFDAFLKLLPTLLLTHRDKYALMKNQEILGYYSSAEDARVAAENFIKDGVYSIQQVTDASIDLGFFTHAVPVNPIQP